MTLTRMLTAFALACLMGGGASAQPNMDEIEYEVTDLGGGVHMLANGGGNIGLAVGADAVVLIDDGYQPLGKKLLAAIREITPQPVSYVINTHWHFDHVGSNELIADSGAVVVAHNNVRKRMSSEQFVKALDRKFDPSPAGALPVVTFAAEINLHLNGGEIRVRHIHHAHTDGDAIIFMPDANVIHAGDTFWNGFYPLIDLSSGGGIDGMIRAADAMLSMADEKTKIIPGHGPLADRVALQEYRDMLVTVSERLNAMLGAGFVKSAVLAADPLKDLDEKWGGGFIKPRAFLEFVYEDIAAK